MSDNYGDREVKVLPNPPHWSRALGVGVVVMGLAIGTGELILWPNLVTRFGLGVLIAAFLGLTFQYFINKEVARHALATGESFFTSSSRVFSWFAPLWLFSAILMYVWPGWAGAMGTTLKELFGFGTYLGWAWFSLGLVLFLTFIGRTAYGVLEKSLKIIVPVFFVLLLINSFLNLNLGDFKQAFIDMSNFRGLPEGLSMSVLLGAIVFAGAGGLLNLCVSLWYRDKQIGMGKYVGRIINPITGKEEAVSFTGYKFDTNSENMARWKKWMRFVFIDQAVIFWLLGIVTLLLVSLNAYVVLKPLGAIPEGLQVAVAQANIFGKNWGVVGYNAFLVMTFLMLFSVMWTVIDAFTRIITDILYVNSHTGPFKEKLKKIKNVSIHFLYYVLISAIVGVSALLLPYKQPLTLLNLSAVLGGVTMTIYIPILIYLNNFKLDKQLRPGFFTNVVMGFASLFYLYFVIATIGEYLK